MKRAIRSMFVILLVAGSVSLALAAIRDDDGKSHEGGLPALQRRVQKLEAQVHLLISQVTSLQNDVAALKSAGAALKRRVDSLENAVASLQNVVASLGTAVSDIQGQNNWAVVTSSGNVVRHSGSSDVVGTKLVTGTYDVLFTKTDVSKCAYTATIGDVGKAASATPGFITVTGGTIGGIPNDVQVQTFDKTGAPADSAFHLHVSCP
jgi:cell division protein FtsB